MSLVCLLCLLRPVQAQSIISSPSAPGTISGMVTDAQGAPLAGINISACSDRYTYYCYPYFNEAAHIVTQADGSYHIDTLAAGLYRLQFIDPQHVYTTEFYKDVYLYTEASLIPVSGNNITNINATLEAGGAISGSVTSSTGPLLTGVSVSIYLTSANPFDTSQQPIAQASIPPGQTSYTIGGIAAGEYYVCASGVLDVQVYTFIIECYDNVILKPQNLTRVQVAAGQTTPDIDFILDENPAYAQVFGRVVASNGDPVPFGNVSIIAGDDSSYGLYNLSDAHGYYSFTTVISGMYSIMVTDPPNYGEFVTYYGNVSTPAEAIYFPLLSGEKKANVDITMRDGGLIQGRIVLRDGVIPQYDNVTVYQRYDSSGGDAGYWNPFRNAPINPATGVYYVRGLSNGVYRVSAAGRYGGFYFSKFYTTGNSDVYSVEEASNVTITEAMPIANIDFVFSQNFFEGSIQGEVGVNGEPLAGIRVDLYDNYYGWWGNPTSLVYTYTDELGIYQFDGLNDDAYYVSFADLSGRYATQFYGSAADPFVAEAITISGGQHVSGINGVLQLGGSIAGQVMGPDAKPLADVQVYVYRDRAPSVPTLSTGSGYDGFERFLCNPWLKFRRLQGLF
ncbi:MAG: carboxypeptidase regulatory-like domain-containing protein [Caldilineaceae bacterium]